MGARPGTVAGPDGMPVATVRARVRVLGFDGYRRAAHRRRPGRRPRRLVRGTRARPPGPALLDRPAHARRPARRRGGCAGRPGPRLSGAGRLRRGADPRAAAAAVAGDDRAQPVPLAAGSPAPAAQDAPLSLDLRAAGRAGAARRRGAVGPAAVTARQGRRPRLGRPPADAATRLSRRRRAPARRRPRPIPKLAIALDRPEGTVKAQVHRGLACCARCSRPPSGTSARR